MPDNSPARVVSIIDALAAPVGRMYAELRTSLRFLSNEDRDDFVGSLGLGTPETLGWSGITGKPTLDEFLPAITYPSGGDANHLDSINCATAGYVVGKIVHFRDDTGEVTLSYELVDSGVLPSGDGLEIVLPVTAFGTAYWSKRLWQTHTEGARLLQFGDTDVSIGGALAVIGNVTAGVFVGSAALLTALPTTQLSAGAIPSGVTIDAARITSGLFSQARIVGTLYGMPDSDYPFSGGTFASGNGGIYTITLTAARSYSIPSVANYPAGECFIMFDTGCAITATNTVTLTRSGSDTINGTTSITLDVKGGCIVLRSAGSGKWQAWTEVPAALSAAHLGVTVQSYDSDLAALAANTGNGLWARTGTGTGAARSLVAGSSKVTITNGDAVAGNPAVDVVEANLNPANMAGAANIHPPTDVQTFTASGTWTKVGTPKTVMIVCIGAGGGGGGGAGSTATSTFRWGGTGGGGGAWNTITVLGSDLGSTETVTVGTGGTAGTGGVSGADGGDGTAGGVSQFGTTVMCSAYGGGFGKGGVRVGTAYSGGGGGGRGAVGANGTSGTAAGGGPGAATNTPLGGTGAQSNAATTVSGGAEFGGGGGGGHDSSSTAVVGGVSMFGGGGGGTGGGTNSSNSQITVKAGGQTGVYNTTGGGGGAAGTDSGTSPVAGTAGAAGTSKLAGMGGGGGGGSITGSGITGAIGGNGGACGGGGGGGGAGGVTTGSGGNGGAGGRGEVRVYSFY